jgi:hypothetical protein
MPQSIDEANVILAPQAYQNDPKLSLRHAAKIYKVRYSSLLNRYNGIPARRDIPSTTPLSPGKIKKAPPKLINFTYTKISLNA